MRFLFHSTVIRCDNQLIIENWFIFFFVRHTSLSSSIFMEFVRADTIKRNRNADKKNEMNKKNSSISGTSDLIQRYSPVSLLTEYFCQINSSNSLCSWILTPKNVFLHHILLIRFDFKWTSLFNRKWFFAHLHKIRTVCTIDQSTFHKPHKIFAKI